MESWMKWSKWSCVRRVTPRPLLLLMLAVTLMSMMKARLRYAGHVVGVHTGRRLFLWRMIAGRMITPGNAVRGCLEYKPGSDSLYYRCVCAGDSTSRMGIRRSKWQDLRRRKVNDRCLPVWWLLSLTRIARLSCFPAVGPSRWNEPRFEVQRVVFGALWFGRTGRAFSRRLRICRL